MFWHINVLHNIMVEAQRIDQFVFSALYSVIGRLRTEEEFKTLFMGVLWGRSAMKCNATVWIGTGG